MTLLWAADYTKSDAVAAGFEDDNWNRIGPNNTKNDASGLPWPMLVAAAPDGVRSLKVDMASGGRRNEVVANERYMSSGDNMWFGLSFYLPAGFDTVATAGSSYQVIEQQRQYSDDGSPPVAFEVRKGGLLLTGGYNEALANPSRYAYEQVLLASVTTGARYYVSYRVGPFSTTPGAATCDVVVNGTAVLTGFTVPPPTLAGGDTYRKCGLYRDPANTTAETIWHSDARTGSTFADVDSYSAPVAPSGSPVTMAAQRGGAFFAAT